MGVWHIVAKEGVEPLFWGGEVAGRDVYLYEGGGIFWEGGVDSGRAG